MTERGRSKTSLELVREGCPEKADTQANVDLRVTMEKSRPRRRGWKRGSDAFRCLRSTEKDLLPASGMLQGAY